MLDEELQWLVKNNVIKKKNTSYVYKKDLIEAGQELRYNMEMNMVEEERQKYSMYIMHNAAALSLFHAIELVESQGAHSLLSFIKRMEKGEKSKGPSKSHKMLLEDGRMQQLKDSILANAGEHPKMLMLVDLLKDQFYKKKDSRVLVFTQYRDTASHIVEYLRMHHISSSRFVGQATRQNDEGLSQKEQMHTLELFRGGEFSVLVATSIAEEGLDIPEVDFVVFYEPIPSEVRHIQRMGRTGRKAPGTATILCTENSVDQRYLYASHRKVKIMKDTVSTLNSTLKRLPRRREFAPRPVDVNTLPRSKSAISQDASEDSHGRYPKKDKAATGTHKLRPVGTNAQKQDLGSSSAITQRQVDKTARKVHTMLAKAGATGIDVSSLQGLEEENLLNAALDKLKKIGQIAWKDSSTVILKKNTRPAQGKTYDVVVKKVVQGFANVLVNDKWFARMKAEDFDGPRELVKKGNEFQCVGKLYHEDGKLNIMVRQIVSS